MVPRIGSEGFGIHLLGDPYGEPIGQFFERDTGNGCPESNPPGLRQRLAIPHLDDFLHAVHGDTDADCQQRYANAERRQGLVLAIAVRVLAVGGTVADFHKDQHYDVRQEVG